MGVGGRMAYTCGSTCFGIMAISFKRMMSPQVRVSSNYIPAVLDGIPETDSCNEGFLSRRRGGNTGDRILDCSGRAQEETTSLPLWSFTRRKTKGFTLPQTSGWLSNLQPHEENSLLYVTIVCPRVVKTGSENLAFMMSDERKWAAKVGEAQ